MKRKNLDKMAQCILNIVRLLQICKVSHKDVGSCFIFYSTADKDVRLPLWVVDVFFFAVEITILLKLYTQFLNRRIFYYVI
ncbi:MAG: hypothetical protein C4B58_11650 [Deltaproteobacteria bacterium]|nr:MAG: hypothetical protein C4B58_11650 [Deltaproteobacteria bacterium]